MFTETTREPRLLEDRIIILRYPKDGISFSFTPYFSSEDEECQTQVSICIAESFTCEEVSGGTVRKWCGGHLDTYIRLDLSLDPDPEFLKGKNFILVCIHRLELP